MIVPIFFIAFLPLVSSVFVLPVYAELPDGTMYVIKSVSKKMEKISEAALSCTQLAIRYYEFPDYCQTIFFNLNDMVNQYLNTTKTEIDKALYG